VTDYSSATAPESVAALTTSTGVMGTTGRVPRREAGPVDRLFVWIGTRPRVATGLLLAPGMLWMLLFLIVPLALIVYFSFWTQEGSTLTPDLTLDSYQRFFRSDVYVGVMRNTIQTWLIVLGLTLLIGYPVAFFISMMVDNPRNQTILLLLAIIPLQRLGIIDQPLSFLLYTEFGAILGMTQIYAVFMVGPITFSLGRLDRSVVDAARDLGASPLIVFKDIIWPLSLPGVVAGSIFVSVMVLGEFATNSALSGRKFNLLGNIILTQVGNLKWAFAAVVGVILTILIGIVIGLLLRVVDLRKHL
jgi:putative spermidine/putrescine transport system permease protein